MDPLTINLQVNQALSYNLGYLVQSWSGRLPAGLSFNFTTTSGGPGTNADGVFTGTVTDIAGSYVITVVLSDVNSQVITFVVSNPNPLDSPVISCAGASVVGGVNTITVAAGTIGLQFSATKSGSNWQASLPAGLGINTLGLVSGTLAPGSYPIVVQCQNLAWSVNYNTNGMTQIGTYQLTLVVTPAVPVISPYNGLLTGNYTVGDDLPNSAPFSVQDTAKPVTWSATGLPAGVALNPTTGVLTGKLNTAGTFNVTFTATNSAGSGSYAQVIVVEENRNLPVVSLAAEQPGSSGQSQPLSFAVGQPVAIFFDGTYNPTSWAAADLPNGLTINTTTGVVSGLLRVPGTFRFFVTATNNVGASNALAVTVTATGAAQAFQFVSDDPTLTDLQIDQRSGTVASSRAVSFKQHTRARFALVFLDFGSPVAPPDAASVKMLIRQQDQFEAEALFPESAATLVAAPETQPAYLLVEMDIAGEALATVFKALLDGGTAAPTLAVMTDVTWRTNGVLRASQTFFFTIDPAVTY